MKGDELNYWLNMRNQMELKDRQELRFQRLVNRTITNLEYLLRDGVYKTKGSIGAGDFKEDPFIQYKEIVPPEHSGFKRVIVGLKVFNRVKGDSQRMMVFTDWTLVREEKSELDTPEQVFFNAEFAFKDGEWQMVENYQDEKYERTVYIKLLNDAIKQFLKQAGIPYRVMEPDENEKIK